MGGLCLSSLILTLTPTPNLRVTNLSFHSWTLTVKSTFPPNGLFPQAWASPESPVSQASLSQLRSLKWQPWHPRPQPHLLHPLQTPLKSCPSPAEVTPGSTSPTLRRRSPLLLYLPVQTREPATPPWTQLMTKPRGGSLPKTHLITSLINKTFNTLLTISYLIANILLSDTLFLFFNHF